MLGLLLVLISASSGASDAAMAKCLGSADVALNRTSVAEQRALVGEAGWEAACEQAREANQRRLRVQQDVLAGRESSEAFSSPLRWTRKAAEARSPLHASLFKHVAEEQMPRASLSNAAKAEYAPGLSPLSEVLLNGIISAEAVKADERSRAWLSEAVREHGWFTISRDGEDADLAAWLIVQHSDADRGLQRHFIGVLEPLVASGKTSAHRFAFLYDRWAMAVGAPLRYGLNGKCVGPGKWEPLPIAERSTLDERREQSGLPPFAEWAEQQSSKCI